MSRSIANGRTMVQIPRKENKRKFHKDITREGKDAEVKEE